MNITKNIHEWLFSLMPETTASIVEMVLIAVVYLAIFAVAGLYLVLLERRVAAWFQLRLGPNRVGYQGLLQTMADALKLVSKELTGTLKADKFLYNLAPYFVIVTALMAMSLFPFTKELHAFDINIGIFFLIAISSIGVIGILLAGWSSNNKFALIGAMRSGVQTISYELSVGLSLLTMVLMTGSLQLSQIVEVQEKGGWLIVQGHIPALIAFCIYMIAGTAETNRAPFDLVEAESELGAGFHTEYSGMKFAYFFLAEFINMFIIASIATTVFFGAYLSPFGITENIPLLGVFWFLGKTLLLIFLMMWFRWTFPRLRIDQLLVLEWKYLLPLNLMNLLLMALMVLLGLTIQF
ncbi:NADH-quinone oxidoreductase subunit NuoH [Flavobacterium alvei]|uniref:NADH-quinone oxidoreductase subunit H n=1 Tax=Flavobacterium alvei TaxID=2080416 RepID=A0A2S5AAK2_9FLAO|nr:NADH-quinone oxidoreductase subunit NuoH [Flavobacterium alvei]POY39585.1 NADH-quinone oxidoreductase subunit NuoH [Flavobacterium alvei]